MRKWKRIIVHAVNDTGMAEGLLVTSDSKNKTSPSGTPVAAN